MEGGAPSAKRFVKGQTAQVHNGTKYAGRDQEVYPAFFIRHFIGEAGSAGEGAEMYIVEKRGMGEGGVEKSSPSQR